MRDFHDLRTARKGEAGERIVRQILEARGWTVYSAPDGPHPIDFIAWNGERWIAADAKTYPRRACCLDTGIDAQDYRKYQRLPFPVLLFFVDSIEQAIYAAFLEELAGERTEAHGKVFFPLERLKIVRRLSPSELRAIGAEKEPERYQGIRKYF